MYNGIGLATARGSGTNGYVVKNLSAFRPREGPPGGFGTASNFDDFPKHRQPDQGILDHERKRQIEVKCVELTDELEEKGFTEDQILEEVGALRTKLLAAMPSSSQGRHFKPHETHSIAQAKEAELARMRGAFGVSNDYKEGASFDREEQERIRAAKRAQYEEKDRIRAEKILEQEAQAEERKEEEKKKRREQERRRIADEREAARRPHTTTVRDNDPAPGSRRPNRDSRSRSPVTKRRSPSPRDSRSPSPVRRQRDPSSSPPPRARRRRSSTPPTRQRRYSSSSGSRSPSPPPRSRA
ncbi:cwf21-domain-containing protein [Phaffia rhodozyma]|uniref:Cwf21-domain-containing protein n=1 Tax=Phaffia rhodozyma TaxID=264483 RepID=A0A0F7SHX2_PHARH|nr:cwf21-domain-containing protein [Phaffia rhodozyma]